MTYSPEVIAELEILSLFNLANSQEGLKIHNQAGAEALAAAARLHAKGLITLQDGGYLTRLGQDAAEHAQVLLSILTPPSA